MRKEHEMNDNKKRTDGKARDENELQKTMSDMKHQIGINGRSLSQKHKKMKEW